MHALESPSAAPPRACGCGRIRLRRRRGTRARTRRRGGCGSSSSEATRQGYNVVALASPERFVLGLDISDMTIEMAKQISDQGAGPPYNNTVADCQKVLEPLGFKAVLMEDNELSIKPRKGHEKTWKVEEMQTAIISMRRCSARLLSSF